MSLREHDLLLGKLDAERNHMRDWSWRRDFGIPFETVRALVRQFVCSGTY